MRCPLGKFTICAIVALASTSESTFAETYLKPTGILRLDNQTSALFEENYSSPDRFYRTIRLAPGEHILSGKKSLFLLSVDATKGLIEFELGGSNQVAQIKSSLATDQSGIILESANIDQFVAVYPLVSKKNILPHPGLPAHKFTFNIELSDLEAAAKKMREQLDQAQIVVLPFSASIEVAVPKKLADLKFDRTTFLKSKDPAARLQPGTLELFSPPIEQAIQVCADLLGMGYERPRPVADFKYVPHEIHLTSATAEEACDALQLLIEWQGYRFIINSDGKLSAEAKK